MKLIVWFWLLKYNAHTSGVRHSCLVTGSNRAFPAKINNYCNKSSVK